jgi:hypothetical protein
MQWLVRGHLGHGEPREVAGSIEHKRDWESY